MLLQPRQSAAQQVFLTLLRPEGPARRLGRRVATTGPQPSLLFAANPDGTQKLLAA